MPTTAPHSHAPPPIPEHDACGVAFVADRAARASHELLARGLAALERLSHRGAIGERGQSPDGAGVLTAIPWHLLDPELPPAYRTGCQARRLAGACLIPRDLVEAATRSASRALGRAGWRVVRWRMVPVDLSALPLRVRAGAPVHLQVFAVARAAAPWSPWRTRRLLEAWWERGQLAGCSLASLSDRTIVYKALAVPARLPRLFSDLADSAYRTPFVVVHQRFSTNSMPRWDLAQPFRVLAHNGEINTIRGNRLWMAARQSDAEALPSWARGPGPVVRSDGSDSQSLDDAVELLRELGDSTPRALLRLLPPAWDDDPHLPAAVRDAYRLQSASAEPWEGPAAIVFADGRHVGALVDRNGFRPFRTLETADGLVCGGSEAGLFDVPASQVASRGRLGPGEMIAVDLERQTVQRSADLHLALAADGADVRASATSIHRVASSPAAAADTRGEDLDEQQQLFGWTREELDVIVRPIACEGHEAVGSMGDDTTLAALSARSRPLFDYFRQRFAQVTNPPLDPVRESAVMSLRSFVGRRGSWTPGGAPPAVVELDSPVLDGAGMAALLEQQHVRVAILPIAFPRDGAGGPWEVLTRLQDAACGLVSSGTRVLVLSDRHLAPSEAALPSLLAVAAVDGALRDRGLRLRAGIIAETGEVRDAHQLAALCAFGASGVHPYLLLGTAAGIGGAGGPARALAALEAGLRKVLSKMGVCSFEAYCGGRLFDAIGLDRRLSAAFFRECGGMSGDLTLERLAAQAIERRRSAAAGQARLPHPGFHIFRRDGDHHAFNPLLVRRLHESAAGDAEAYQAFAGLSSGRPATAVRDLLAFRTGIEPVPVLEVEDATAICRRFFASAMSIGALSPEAHRVLAIGMNLLGARSNCGEGGEPSERHDGPDGKLARSATRQVASARFGVTPAYLAGAAELQIKMAQGSKPGEGGQLPGAKVDALIARLRHVQPGTTLVSPPPHHDIYSIEDLAQLIYDLRTFHPAARINVKLVAQPGIGVVAAGVVKAGAHAIQISGHEGGTGASPRGSIKHAGVPWELGLAEAHQALVSCGLRHRVVLQTDGGLQTARDVAIAAALGADEFGFGTAALVALGCVMARQCHQNTCPVGIASQRPELRARFDGTPEMVVRYMRLLAEDFRTILAGLGLRTAGELVGRADLLRPRGDRLPLDLAPLLAGAPSPDRRRAHRAPAGGPLAAALARAARGRLGSEPVTFIGSIRNTDRAFGAALAGCLAAQSGDRGSAEAPVEVRLSGSAGQSFWAFALPGMHVRLEGEANDGVGKSMHGGEIVIRPPAADAGRSPVLVGNAALYGATGGRLFVAGRAGERFAVRNSGAWAVVEGVGDHGCEYMTGGAVLVLGPIGRNFAAGMTGGVAYVLGDDATVGGRVHRGSVAVQPGLGVHEGWVRAWISEHYERTGSARAAELLRRWPQARERFHVLQPRAEALPLEPPATLSGRTAAPARG